MAQYGDVDVYTSSFRPMRNTVSGSPYRTFMKMLVEPGSGKVVGCHMVGDHAAEIMQVGGGQGARGPGGRGAAELAARTALCLGGWTMPWPGACTGDRCLLCHCCTCCVLPGVRSSAGSPAA